jgi:colanic acid biosynthesis glycosyl transferase WcaI
MVTTFSYYPTWRKLPEDEGKLYRTDIVNGVPVHRCWHFVPERVSTLKRIIHEATFITTSFLRLLVLARPDVLVVVSPPLALGAAAGDELAEARAVRLSRAGFATRRSAEARHAEAGLVHARAALAGGVCVCEGRARLEHHARDARCVPLQGVPEEKLVYFPNAIALRDAPAPPRVARFRQRNGFGPTSSLPSTRAIWA